jgi:hypothetical protein
MDAPRAVRRRGCCFGGVDQESERAVERLGIRKTVREFGLDQHEVVSSSE